MATQVQESNRLSIAQRKRLEDLAERDESIRVVGWSRKYKGPILKGKTSYVITRDGGVQPVT